MSSLKIIAFFLITACAHTPSAGAYNIDVEHCYSLFEDIMAVQTERTQFIMAQQQSTDDYNAGRMTKKQFSKARKMWLKTENKLASKANKLYSRAYEDKCFDKLKKELPPQ